MTFSIDGTQVASDYVEGDGNYNYSHGDNVARVKVTAGDHRLRVSWPDLANHPNPFGLINADGRQELFVDYMRVLGPFNPSAPSPSQRVRMTTANSLTQKSEAEMTLSVSEKSSLALPKRK